MKNSILKRTLAAVTAVALAVTAGVSSYTPVQAAQEPEKVKYMVELEKSADGFMELEHKDGLYEMDEEVLVTLNPNAGYEVEEVLVKTESDETIDTLEVMEGIVFIMPEQDVKVSTSFTKVVVESETVVAETEARTEKQTESQEEVAADSETEKDDEPQEEVAEELTVKELSKMPRSVASVSKYMSVREVEGNASEGATIITEGSLAHKLPNGYNGYFVKSTPEMNLPYKAINDGGNACYDMSKMTSYNEDGKNAGKLYAIYPNIFKYNGQSLDVKMTILDWEAQSNRVTEDRLCALRFHEGRVGLEVNQMYSVEFDIEFFVHGTTTPVAVKGYATFKDVDHQQGIVFKKGWENYYVGQQAKNKIGYSQTLSGKPYFYDKGESDDVSSSDITNWISATFSGSKINTTYTFFNIKTDENGNRVVSNNTAGGYMGFDSDKLIKGNATINKKVSDADEKLKDENTLRDSKEDYTYTYNVSVPGESPNTFYEKFIIKNVFEGVVDIKETAIKVVNSDGKDVTKWFTIAKTGQTLTLTATSRTLGDSDFYAQIYTVTVPVSVKADAKLDPYWNSGKQYWEIPNTATLEYDVETITSNEVWTRFNQIEEGAIQIKKVDSESKEDIGAGVVFEVYEWNGSTYSSEVYDTLEYTSEYKEYRNSKPYTITNANAGKFKVVEVKAADGYENSKWETEIDFGANPNAILTFTVENDPIPSVAIEKTAYKGNPLESGEKTETTTDPENKKTLWFTYEDTIYYLIKVTNDGKASLHDSVVTDTMEDALKAAIDADAATFEVSEEMTSSLGNKVKVKKNSNTEVVLDLLLPGDSVELLFTAKVADKEKVKELAKLTELVNNVKVKSGELEKGDDDTVNLYNPLMKITKVADKTVFSTEGERLSSGLYSFEGTITYTITAENYGNVDLFDLAIVDTVSAELNEVIVEGATFAAEPVVKTTAGKEVNITQVSNTEVKIDMLEVGDSVSLTFVAKVRKESDIKNLKAMEELLNNVKITGSYNDDDEPKKVPEDEDDSSDEWISISNPKLVIAKLADKTTGVELVDGRYTGTKKAGTYETGQEVSWNVDITNTGNRELTELAVEDILSESLAASLAKVAFDYKSGATVKTTAGNEAKITIKSNLKLVIDKLAAGDSITLVVKGKIKDQVSTVDTEMENTVTVTAKADDKLVTKTKEHEDKDAIKVKANPKETEDNAAVKPTSNPRTSSGVKTGDNSQLAIYLVVAGIALAAIVFVARRKKKAA